MNVLNAIAEADPWFNTVQHLQVWEVVSFLKYITKMCHDQRIKVNICPQEATLVKSLFEYFCKMGPLI